MTPTVEVLVERDLLEIAQRCARAQHVTVEEMLGRGRTVPVVNARAAFYRELAALPDGGWSASAIARLVDRHVSSVLHALEGA